MILKRKSKTDFAALGGHLVRLNGCSGPGCSPKNALVMSIGKMYQYLSISLCNIGSAVEPRLSEVIWGSGTSDNQKLG